MNERSPVKRVSAPSQTAGPSPDELVEGLGIGDKLDALGTSIRAYQRAMLTYDALTNVRDGIGPVPLLEFTARTADSGGQPVRLAIDLEWLEQDSRSDVASALLVPISNQCKRHLTDIARLSASAVAEFPDE